MDDAEAAFVMDAVEFVAEFGHRFLPLYAFDPATGMWTHRDYRETREDFSLDEALKATGCDATALPLPERARRYAESLAGARRLADQLGEPPVAPRGPGEGLFGELQFFHVS
jgi:hypothetical protein